MAAPMRDFGMIMAAWGFGVEAGTHGMRLILSGALDRFPRLRIVLGHMGEAVHFWTARLDNFYRRAKVEWASTQRLELKPSEYLRRNFSITTSGQENPDALIYSIRTLGLENIMWAIDYPYEDSAGAVAFLENAPITGRERAAIFGENADRIFRLKSMAWRSQGV
jgi:predicted TIM-barrel fold metal-dependent hydrolase